MLLKGEKIELRALEPTDLSLLYTWENNTDIWQVSNTSTPYSKYILEQYILNSHNDIYTTKQLRLIIQETVNGNVVGCIDLFDFDPAHLRAGIGILIANKQDRKNGYATEALDLLIKYSFSVLNLQQLYCNITVDNTASCTLFKKMGFELVGTKKQWIRTENNWLDEQLYQLIKR
ncbi:MAG: GNAT family N-acetyltransferase [Bacteroidetes bacterium]|nr:GNAT family N-acetyltransferase [Bacteroidota bacterium]